ncbi:MAG: PEP-CTERM sorting domain-containing protein [Lacipirellulaceae bacterium]
MSLRNLFAALCGVAVLAVGQANAATLVDEDFSYADGSLVPNGGWANHSGTAGDLLVSSGQAVVQHGTPSEDANIQFATQDSGILTATFDITVEDSDDQLTGSDFEYFAHFFTQGSFNFRSRVDVVAPSGGGDYTLGISSSGSTADATLLVDFDFGDTVPVEITFDFATGTASLTAGGSTITGDPGATGQSLDAFGLRQSDSSNNETVIVDNLVITAIPEPTSLVLFALGAFGLVTSRKRG